MCELKMRQMALIPSLVCDLRCKLCASAVPYYKNLKPTPIERLKESVSRYFKVVSFVEKYAVSGGEPMLYKQLPELFVFLSGYSEQMGSIEIITNGTVVPGQQLIEAVKPFGNKFRFMVDNYGENLSVKVKEIEKVLTDADIPYDVRNYTNDDPHCGGWVDFGDLRERKHSREDAEKLYSKCAYPQKMKFCFNTIDGVMYPCSPVRRCKEFGVADDYNDYIDLFDDSLTVEEQRKKIQAIYDGKCLSACAFCNGMCDDSPRYAPAEQL